MEEGRRLFRVLFFISVADAARVWGPALNIPERRLLFCVDKATNDHSHEDSTKRSSRDWAARWLQKAETAGTKRQWSR
jgi:hypothetical protein